MGLMIADEELPGARLLSGALSPQQGLEFGGQLLQDVANPRIRWHPNVDIDIQQFGQQQRRAGITPAYNSCKHTGDAGR